MRRRPRILGAAMFLVVGGTACNAILGIHDLSAPDPVDGGDGSVNNETGADGTTDGSNEGGCSDCVLEPQEGGAIYPTWKITSDNLFIVNATGAVPPTPPEYVDAGPGALLETHSGLTWSTAVLFGEAGAGVTLAEAASECKRLGPDWRVPTRIELATTQFREELDASSGDRTRCIPSSFELLQYPSWTATSVPGKDGGEYYIEDERVCAFGANPPDSPFVGVRCVKGPTKPANFKILRDRDTVHALETNLEWERVGLIVSSFADAKKHCDSKGMRVPIIQELYSILDTRALVLTDTRLFPAPAAQVQGFLSQTVYLYEDGGAHYAAVGVTEGTRGWEDTLPPTGPAEKQLVRCVREYVP